MNFEKYTIRSQEVLQKAQTIAKGYQQQIIEKGHILKAIIEQEDNMITFLTNKIKADKTSLNQQLDSIVMIISKYGPVDMCVSHNAYDCIKLGLSGTVCMYVYLLILRSMLVSCSLDLKTWTTLN